MATEGSGRRTNLLARCMKGIGYLTDPKTSPGKVFQSWEESMTSAATRLGTSDLYLNLVGKMMERTFRMHAMSIEAMESTLRLFRLPTASDIHDVRAQVHALSGQVEAVSAQLEAVLAALEEQKWKASAAGREGASREGASREGAVR